MVRQVHSEPAAPLALWPARAWAGQVLGQHKVLPSHLAHAQAPPLPSAPSPGKRQAGVDMPGSRYVPGVGISCKNILVGRLMSA